MNKKELITYAKRAVKVDKDQVIISACTGKKVLDVGCIGQDRNFNSENWLHNKIRAVAQKLDGVDILENEIRWLRQNGYSVYSVEELNALNAKYEVIIMADVIEHVNDPVGFLTFYASFLSENGVLLVSTPNSNRSNNFISILFSNNYSVNPEHVCWFCPRTFAEVADRAKLSIQEFHWVNHYFNTGEAIGLYQKFKLFLINLLISMRSNFSPNMIFILSNDTK